MNCCGFVVGTAGTVGTGAIDDIQSLADLCSSHDNLWFHIDGAIGAVARISPQLRPLFSGIERADSLAFDLHKWLFVPYECGCILVRDGELHRSTFAQPIRASYLTMMDGGIMPFHAEPLFSDYCFELSRGMKALKVWMTFKTYGLNRLGSIMEQNVNQVQYFASLIALNSNELQLLGTGPINIICFRYRHKIIEDDVLNMLNKRLLVTLQERGIAVVSPYIFHGTIFALRMCITNHRTRKSDLDEFLGDLLSIGREITSEILCETEILDR